METKLFSDTTELRVQLFDAYRLLAIMPPYQADCECGLRRFFGPERIDI